MHLTTELYLGKVLVEGESEGGGWAADQIAEDKVGEREGERRHSCLRYSVLAYFSDLVKEKQLSRR